MSKDFLDLSSFTDTMTRFSLVQHALSMALRFDVFEGKVSWQASVLSPPIKLSDGDASGMDGSARPPPEGSNAGSAEDRKKRLGTAADQSPPVNNNKFWFKARILGNPSPHDYLPDPCRADVANNANLAYRLIGLHTTFISADDPTAEGTSVPKVGDIVNVVLQPNQFSYDLQFGKYVGIASAWTGGMVPSAPPTPIEDSGVGWNDANKAALEVARQDLEEEASNEPELNPDCTQLSVLFKDFDPAIFAPPGPSRGAGGPLPTSGTITPENIIPDVITHAESLGYKTWTTPYRMWYFGIRNGERKGTDKFDDIIGAVYYDDTGQKHTLYWQGTLDPGNYYRTNPYNGIATAYIKPGQYLDTWKFPTNHGKDNPYLAYAQRGEVQFWRDTNKDTYADIDDDASPSASGARNGLNLHRTDVDGKHSHRVGKYSAGCQVVTGPGAWDQWFRLGEEQIAKTKNVMFSYTLMDRWFP